MADMVVIAVVVGTVVIDAVVDMVIINCSGSGHGGHRKDKSDAVVDMVVVDGIVVVEAIWVVSGNVEAIAEIN